MAALDPPDFAEVAAFEQTLSYIDALQEKRYTDAVPLLLEAIRRDDAFAMAQYGNLLALGRGIEQNLEEAAAWFRQSAARGERFGQMAFGMMLVGGIGVTEDHAEAAHWLYRAASAGYRDAKSALRDLIEAEPALVGIHFDVAQYLALIDGLPREETLQ